MITETELLNLLTRFLNTTICKACGEQASCTNDMCKACYEHTFTECNDDSDDEIDGPCEYCHCDGECDCYSSLEAYNDRHAYDNVCVCQDLNCNGDCEKN